MPMFRKCEKCQAEKDYRGFAKNDPVCLACRNNNHYQKSPPLEVQAEHRRQEKMLRAELKKLARQRLDAKKAAKVARKRKAIEAPVIEPVATEINPVQRELARRELSRRKLIEFIKMFHPRYKAGWVHYDICRRLEKFSADVDAGLSPRLMILMPPRHGKSQIASKLFPAWHFGHYTHHEIIACSYNISLALEFSREVRDVVRSPLYGHLFPKAKLNTEIQAAENWKFLSETGVGAGGYVAAGVGVGITGKGAHVLIIDDPVKNAEEAESVETRMKIWNWYLSSAYSRLAPGGGVLIIQTCWHDDDLAGHIQQLMRENPEDEFVDKFEVVKYPAIAEEDEEFRLKGEALHPERYDLNKLLRIQKQFGGPNSRYWAALYQQNPVPAEGAYFTKDMQRYRDSEPSMHDMHIYQAWDFAISSEQQLANNWTVGYTVGLDYNDDIHVLERVRIKTNDAARIEDAIIDMYAKYPTVHGIGFEDGQIFKTMRTSLMRRMKERRVYIPLDEKENILKPITDKEVRARPLQARLQNKKVTFPRGQAWVDEVWGEFLRFPSGSQDDQIDALAWCVQMLASKSPPKPPQPVWTNKVEETVKQKIERLARLGNDTSHMAA